MNTHVLPIAGGRRVVGERDGGADLLDRNRSREVAHGMPRSGKTFERRVELGEIAFPRHFDLMRRLDGNAAKQGVKRGGKRFGNFEIRVRVHLAIFGDNGDRLAKLRFVRAEAIGKIIQRRDEFAQFRLPESEAEIRHRQPFFDDVITHDYRRERARFRFAGTWRMREKARAVIRKYPPHAPRVEKKPTRKQIRAFRAGNVFEELFDFIFHDKVLGSGSSFFQCGNE